MGCDDTIFMYFNLLDRKVTNNDTCLLECRGQSSRKTNDYDYIVTPLKLENKKYFHSNKQHKGILDTSQSCVTMTKLVFKVS